MTETASETTDTGPLLYSYAAAAEALQVSEGYLRKGTAARRLPHRRVGKVVRFSRADLDAIIAATAVPAANTAPRRRTT